MGDCLHTFDSFIERSFLGYVFNDGGFEFGCVTGKVVSQVFTFLCRADGPSDGIAMLEEVADDPHGNESIGTGDKDLAWGLNDGHISSKWG